MLGFVIRGFIVEEIFYFAHHLLKKGGKGNLKESKKESG